MGFWHTGYFEFHEPVGLDFVPTESAPILYFCSECGESFESSDGLRLHRFERHPLRRPQLWLNGREVGNTAIKVTTKLNENNIRLEGCNAAILNGKHVAINELPFILSNFLSNTCVLILIGKGEAKSKFKINFCIASSADIAGVESVFINIAENRNLDIKTIDQFILLTKKFSTALSYCNGISEYLYGVLTKERHPQVHIEFKEYEKKYNIASNELKNFDRPLARAIRSAIGFHFNHFKEVFSISNEFLVCSASSQYISAEYLKIIKEPISNIDRYITERTTEKIINLSTLASYKLIEQVDKIEHLLKSDIVEYDKVKLHMLLAKIYKKYNNNLKFVRHIKELRRFPQVETFCALLQRDSENAHE